MRIVQAAVVEKCTIMDDSTYLGKVVEPQRKLLSRQFSGGKPCHALL